MNESQLSHFVIFQDGRTPLAVAAVTFKDDIVKLLLSRKADTTIKDKVSKFDVQRL